MGRIKSYLSLLANAINYPKALSPKKTLFLISHMRSYSTLLTHILCSNPQLMGGSEMMQPYKSALDLIKLRLKCAQLSKEVRSTAVDKILINQYKVDDNFLTKYQPKIIFTIRKPLDTINSMYNMYLKYENKTCTAEELVDYYVDRASKIKCLYQVASANQCKCMSFSAEQMVEEPDKILDNISKFLKLDTPLRKEYETHDDTGKMFKGDPSKNIHAGKVLGSRNVENTIQLSQELEKKAINAYEEVLQYFKSQGNFYG